MIIICDKCQMIYDDSDSTTYCPHEIRLPSLPAPDANGYVPQPPDGIKG